MQLTAWGCGGTRKIISLFELPLPAADAQAGVSKKVGTTNNGIEVVLLE